MSDTAAPWRVDVYREEFFALRYRAHKAVVDFEVHMLAAAGEGESGLIYADERHTSSHLAFESPSHEPIEGGHILHGFLRFDGCVNIQQTDKDCMMHFCDFHLETPALAHIIKAISALGQKMGDTWCGHRTESIELPDGKKVEWKTG